MSRNGVKVVMMMRRVAIGKSAGGYTQAIGTRSRRAHNMGREQLVGTTWQMVLADGDMEVLMEGQEVREEWMGQIMEDTDWRRRTKE